MQKGNVLLLMDFEIPVKRLKKRTIKLPYKSMFVNPLTILVANGTMYSGKLRGYEKRIAIKDQLNEVFKCLQLL
ncbi:hypothetical protein ARZ03_10335 [Listeria monocytogenes]|nr:hypothetical protein [Listeria monocytogenes]